MSLIASGYWMGGRLKAIGNMQQLRGRLEHQYSLKVPAGLDLHVVAGETKDLGNGQLQVLTTQEEALRISKDLIEAKAQFSVNPITLDDIFTYTVGSIDVDVKEENEEEEE